MAATACHAQAYTPPPPPLTPGPCVPTKEFPCDPPPAPKAPDVPSVADKFPFPGEAPATPAPTATDPAKAADKFPFPGEPATPQPAKAADKFPFPGDSPDSSSSSSNSSSSSSSSGAPESDPSAPKLKDAGSAGSTRFERRKLAVPEDNDHRELEDLEVSHYYMTTGNFLAAYLRAQDAVKLYPDDENAHYALAVSAEKLKKLPEAIAAYKKYLELAPDGEKSKQVHRALEAMPAK